MPTRCKPGNLFAGWRGGFVLSGVIAISGWLVVATGRGDQPGMPPRTSPVMPTPAQMGSNMSPEEGRGQGFVEPAIYHPVPRTAGETSLPVNRTPGERTAALGSSASPSVQTASHVTSTQSSLPLKPPTSANEREALKRPTSAWSATLSMLASLLVVLTLFMGVAWLLKRASPQPVRGLPKEIVHVLGRVPLATRQQMVLIRFGRKLVLVSQQMGETSTLSEIDDPREVDYLLGLCEQHSATSISHSFRDVLQQLTKGAAG